MRFFATAAKGTEPALRDELRELRFARVRADRGGVHFEGSHRDGMRACFETRVAMRVLRELATFDARSGDELYAGAREAAGDRGGAAALLTPAQTLAVRATCTSSTLTHSQFVAQRVKDALVDVQRETFGGRSSVDRAEPDVLFSLRLAKDQATLYADLSGEPLHKRGYRPLHGAAPLKETLAAALLRLAGWDRRSALLDPMCGSGTFPIEAWLWAGAVPPQHRRAEFGFERWASHDDEARRTVADLRRAGERALEEARSAGERAPIIEGRDADPEAIALARAAARNAGADLPFSVARVASLGRVDPGSFLIVNPPYGERLAGGAELFAELGRAVASCRGSRFAVLAGSPAIARAIPLRPALAHGVWNGDLECRLLVYEP